MWLTQMMSERRRTGHSGYALFCVAGIILVMLALSPLMTASVFAAEPDIPLDAEHFPDPHFRSYISRAFDPDGSGDLDGTEISSVTVIRVSMKGIADIRGVESFPNLKELDCSENQIRTLDVTKNTKLEKLYCGENQLKSLDISTNGRLRMLSCRSNQLEALDVMGCPRLEYLSCGCNSLTRLDLRKNTGLTYVECRENKITSLDLSRNKALEILDCPDNRLGKIDVSALPALYRLYVYNNHLTRLCISGNPNLLRAYREGKRTVSDGIVIYAREYSEEEGMHELWHDAGTGVLTKSGWITRGGKRYYLNPDGAEQTGWKKIGGKKYYFGAQGAMQTGWKKIGGKRYYFGAQGAMQTGWKKIGGKRYYFRKTGEAECSKFISGYWLKKDGSRWDRARCAWKKSKAGRRYGNAKGWYVKGTTVVIDGKRYTFDKKGYLVK